jgi:hypothetical protein
MTSQVARLRGRPPEPTLENPLAQLDWLCERFIRRYSNTETKIAVRSKFKAYKEFLTTMRGADELLQSDPRFYLSDHLDPFTLCHAAEYWRSKGLTEHSILGYMKTARSILESAAAEGFTSVQFFISPSIGNPRRGTDIREAYNDKELEFIRTIIEPTTKYAMKIVEGHKPSGLGKDPALEQIQRDLGR